MTQILVPRLTGNPADDASYLGAGTGALGTPGTGSGSGLPKNYRNVSSAPGSTAAGDFLVADATSGSFAIPQPASRATGDCIEIAKTDTSANTVSFFPATVNGDATGAVLTAPCVVLFEWDATNSTWRTPGSTGGVPNTILTTSGAPSNATGNNGDYANDPTAQIMYGPKAAGVWPAGVLYKGTNGTNGTNGAISTVQVNDAAQTVRAALDLKAGTNVTLAAVDNAGSGRTEVTVNATGGGGGGDLIHQYRSGGNIYKASGMEGSSIATFQPVQGRVYWSPFIVGAGTPTFGSLFTNISGQGGGGTIDLGIYADSGSLVPGALITHLNAAIAGNAAAGVQGGVLAANWSPAVGLYWLAFGDFTSGTDPTIRCFNNWWNPLIPQGSSDFNSGSGKNLAYSQAGLGSLPGTAAASTATTNAPVISIVTV